MKTYKLGHFVLCLVIALFLLSCAGQKEQLRMKYYPRMDPETWRPTLEDLEKGNCDVYQDISEIYRCYPPKKFGMTVSRHVEAMRKKGYFDQISQQDLFHGHLLFFRDGPKNFKNVEEIFENVQGILYHTREFLYQWRELERVGRPILDRPPRSIIGYPNGKIEPLKDVISVAELGEDYVKYGTIHPWDFCQQKPEYQDCQGLAVLVDGQSYKIDLNGITLVQWEKGEYIIQKQKYDIFLRLLPKGRNAPKNSNPF